MLASRCAARPGSRLAGLTALTAMLLVAAACGSGGDGAAPDQAPVETAPEPTTTPAPPNVSLVAEAVVPVVGVYDSPEAPQPSRTLNNPQAQGAPLVLLVKEEQPEWVLVQLPVRPNGATGWVRMSDVRVNEHDYRIRVELGARRITVWQGAAVLLQEPVGVGKQDAPTPIGLHYTTALVRSDAEQQRKYGPFVYVLSGFSEVLSEFEGGDGASAIHGTNNPANLGQAVSFGCVRMSNEGITRLAGVLPLGVPVEVVA